MGATDIAGRLYVAWLVILLLAFGALTWVIVQHPVMTTDVAIERSVQAVQTPWMDRFAAAISGFGFPPESIIIDAIIVAVIFIAGHRREAVCAAFAAAGSAGVWFLLTATIHRPRPTADLVRVVAEIPFSGFPSGHVLNLTSFFGFLTYLAMTRMQPGLRRTVVVVVCCLVIVAIGFARIYSGEHWPTDVLAGYLLGAVWLMISISLYRWWALRTGAAEPVGRRP